MRSSLISLKYFINYDAKLENRAITHKLFSGKMCKIFEKTSEISKKCPKNGHFVVFSL